MSALEVRCPTCGAAEGVPCLHAPRAGAHLLRRRAWTREQKNNPRHRGGVSGAAKGAGCIPALPADLFEHTSALGASDAVFTAKGENPEGSGARGAALPVAPVGAGRASCGERARSARSLDTGETSDKPGQRGAVRAAWDAWLAGRASAPDGTIPQDVLASVAGKPLTYDQWLALRRRRDDARERAARACERLATEALDAVDAWVTPWRGRDASEGGETVAERVIVLAAEGASGLVRRPSLCSETWAAADAAVRWLRRAEALRACGDAAELVEQGGEVIEALSAPVPLWRSARCDHRIGCPDCARRVARRDVRELAPVVAEVLRADGWHVAPGAGATVLMLTLTHRPSPTRYLSTSLDAHMGALRRWQRSRAVRRLVAGGRWSLEVTRRDDDAAPWHAHTHHLIAVSGPVGRARLASLRHALRDAWQVAHAAEWRSRGWEVGDDDGLIDLDRPRRGARGAAREVAKYISKPLALARLPTVELAEVLRAFSHRRRRGDWGIWSVCRRRVERLAAEERAEREERLCGPSPDAGEDAGQASYHQPGRLLLGRTARGMVVVAPESWRGASLADAYRAYLARWRLCARPPPPT